MRTHFEEQPFEIPTLTDLDDKGVDFETLPAYIPEMLHEIETNDEITLPKHLTWSRYMNIGEEQIKYGIGLARDLLGWQRVCPDCHEEMMYFDSDSDYVCIVCRKTRGDLK